MGGIISLVYHWCPTWDKQTFVHILPGKVSAIDPSMTLNKAADLEVIVYTVFVKGYLRGLGGWSQGAQWVRETCCHADIASMWKVLLRVREKGG